MDKKNRFEAKGLLIYKGYDSSNTFVYRFVIPGLKKVLYIDCQYEGKMRPDIKVKDHAIVKGYIRGYSFDNKKGKHVSVQTAVATSFEKVAPLLEREFGIPSRYHSEGYFKAYVSGQYLITEKINDTMEKLHIATSGGPINKKASFVEAVRNTQKRFDVEKLERGDTVCLVANGGCYVNGYSKRVEDLDFTKVRHSDVSLKLSLFLEDIGVLEKTKEPVERTTPSRGFIVLEDGEVEMVENGMPADAEMKAQPVAVW